MRALHFVLAIGLLVLFCAACEPPDYPGESLGSFRIQGILDSNSCGHDAVPAFPSLAFESELRMDGSVPYWRRDGLLPIDGIASSDGSLQFEFRQTFSLAPNPDGMGQQCFMVQTEWVSVTLLGDGTMDSDAGVQSDLQGTNIIRWAAADEASCAYATTAHGGPFQALPCTVNYSLAGERRGETASE